MTIQGLPKEEKKESIYHLMLGVLLVFELSIMLILSYWACRYSYYESVDHNVLVKDAGWKHILLFLLASLATVGIDRILQKSDKIAQEKICVAALIITCTIAFFLGTFYVLRNPYYPVGDQISTTAFSAYCREGNFIMLCNGGYIGMHQHQKGLGALYEIVFAIFGNFNYTPAKILHVFWWMLTICAGYQFLKLTMDRAVFRLEYCVLLLGCIPYLIFLPYIYGDILSISFCMVLFWAAAAYERYAQKRYLALAAFVSAIAILARKNTLIVLVAVGIYAVLLCLKKKKVQCLLIGLTAILAAVLSVKAVDVMYEYRSGYPSGIGIPSILYVAMGLQDTDGEAGIYNRYHQSTFAENDFQQEPAAQQGKEYIKERLGEFAENPGMASDFFKRKLEGQWIVPLFESLRSTDSFADDRELPSYIADLYYGKLHDVAWKLANYYQSIMYFAGLAFTISAGVMWWKKKETPVSVWLPMIAMVGGFLFSIIWEAQARYVFPYYIFLALYVPEGLYVTGSNILKLKKLRKKNDEKKEEKKTKLRRIA